MSAGVKLKSKQALRAVIKVAKQKSTPIDPVQKKSTKFRAKTE